MKNKKIKLTKKQKKAAFIEYYENLNNPKNALFNLFVSQITKKINNDYVFKSKKL